MIARTDFPCGNGRIHWIKPGHFEVESIAYSKAPRYVCFRISDVEFPREVGVVIRPDRHSHDDFRGFQGRIWVKRGEKGNWQALDNSQVKFSPEAIRFPLQLHPAETVYISTEPARSYGDTSRELFHLAEKHTDITSIRSIGASMEERPLIVLRVSGERAEPGRMKPMVFVVAGEHATEFAGEEIVRGILSAVLGNNPVGRALREEFDFEFLLNANPDGNFHGWHQYNCKDWREHNYADRRDRSWHHEFGDYFRGGRDKVSPETLAIGEWVEQRQPAFVLNAHSWTGHSGNPGAFRTAPELLQEPLRSQMEQLDAGAIAVARSLGFDFEVFPSSNICAGHLVDLLIENGKGIGYAIEGHPNLGRELAQHFGTKLIERWLLQDRLLDIARMAVS